MPQGRRKAPFSGKAKKQQIQAKKNRMIRVDRGDEESTEDSGTSRSIQKINMQPREGNSGKNKYALEFFRESREELQKRREDARRGIDSLPLEKQEISDDYFPSEIDLPKRPPWDFSMSKEKLEMREQKYFAEYLQKMEGISAISYFELNLETWRQLWRVLEMSDALLIIVDIRFPVILFPPYLYRYITNDLKKDMILVLNKVDLAPPALVVAWREYFKSQYPSLHILCFTSYPAYNLRGNTNVDGENLKIRRRRGKLRMAAEGASKLLETCKEIVGDRVDLSSWQEKIQEEMNTECDFDDLEKRENVVIVQKEDTSYFEHEKYKNGILTIGCIGTPNVGKSSLMNALMGKKVVSVSRTPGHTKHFQTIFLTKTVCLCDCPGLVFPSTVPKPLQILMGSFPIAQVREPYTAVKFIAERLDLPKLLRIQHQDNDDSWSAMDICDGWAAKRNYVTARAARLDSYRAANSILRMALEGKICLYVFPPGWAKNKEEWEKHPDVETIKWIQANNGSEENRQDAPRPFSSSEDEDEDEEDNQEQDDDFQDKKFEESSGDDDDDEDDEDNQVPISANKFDALLPDS